MTATRAATVDSCVIDREGRTRRRSAARLHHARRIAVSKRGRSPRHFYSDSFLACNKFYRRALPLLAVLLCLPLTLFAFLGDSQWSRVSYIAQVYVWPGNVNLTRVPGGYTGTFRRWTSFGNLTYEAEYLNGRLDGDFYCVYSSGAVEKSKFQNGVEHGPCTTWLPDGRVERIEYKSGSYDGVYQFWHQNGQRAVEKRYRSGLLHGPARVWHNNGTLASRATYAKGFLNGLFEAWHDNGKLKERVRYEQDLKQGLYEQWFPTGDLAARGSFDLNRPIGEWKRWHNTGRLRLHTFYDDDGERVGTWRMWSSSGSLMMERSYAAGQLHGEETIWWSNGVPRAVRQYDHGQRHGRTVEWNSDSTLRVDGVYRHGQPWEGTFIIVDENKSRRIVTFRAGHPAGIDEAASDDNQNDGDLDEILPDAPTDRPITPSPMRDRPEDAITYE